MSGREIDPTVDDVARLITNGELDRTHPDEVAAAIVDLIDRRASEQDDSASTDRFRVAVTRAAVAAAVLGALGLITGFVLAVAAVWATTLHEQLASTAELCAFGGVVLLAGAVVVIASSDAS